MPTPIFEIGQTTNFIFVNGLYYDQSEFDSGTNFINLQDIDYFIAQFKVIKSNNVYEKCEIDKEGNYSKLSIETLESDEELSQFLKKPKKNSLRRSLIEKDFLQVSFN